MFEEGDNVVYPHHGAGVVLKKETRDMMGESRDYLTIKILHNEMTVMVHERSRIISATHQRTFA